MSMDDQDGVIWMDGEYVQWRDAKVHVLTHTLHYGLGCFEGVRAYKTPQGTAIFRLQEHTDRLFDSAHILRMEMPFDKDTLNEVQKRIIKENGLETAYVRPLVYYGCEGLGLHASNLSVHVAVASWAWTSNEPSACPIFPRASPWWARERSCSRTRNGSSSFAR